MSLERKIGVSYPTVSVSAEGDRSWNPGRKPGTKALSGVWPPWPRGASSDRPSQLCWVFKSVLFLAWTLKIKSFLFSHMLGEVSPNVLLIVPKAKLFLTMWNIVCSTFSSVRSFFGPLLRCLQSDCDTTFCSDVSLSKGYFSRDKNWSFLFQEALLLFGTDEVSAFSARNRNADLWPMGVQSCEADPHFGQWRTAYTMVAP